MFEDIYKCGHFSVDDKIDDPEMMEDADYDIYALECLPDHIKRWDREKVTGDDVAAVTAHCVEKLRAMGVTNMVPYASINVDKIEVDIMFQ